MSVISNNILAGASGQAGGAAAGYAIERSLRFNSVDSSHLSKTPSSAGNRRTWTWSGWVKKTASAATDPKTLFGVYGGSASTSFTLRFDPSTDDTLRVENDFTVGAPGGRTVAVFRDYSGWMHVVVSMDTTQSSAASGLKMYVNGVQQTLQNTVWTQNIETLVNSTNAHYIGSQGQANSYLDGYLADIHFIDGQALTPTDFGEYDDNGVWQPKAYAGTYGTNGFHLDFSDNSSAAALGTDSSTNNNDWTVNNLSVTQATYFTFNNLSGGSAAALIDGTLSYTDATFNPVNGAYIDTDISIYGLSAGDTINVRYWNAAHAAGQTCTATFSQHDSSGTLLQTVATQTWDQGQEWNDNSGYVAITLATGFHSIRVTLSNNSTSNPWGIGEMEIQGITLVTDSSNDSLFDSPTNGTQEDTGLGGEVSGNYATLNPLNIHNSASDTLSNGNLECSMVSGSAGLQPSTIAFSSGKWYYETVYSDNGSNGVVGIRRADSRNFSNSYLYHGNGNKYTNAGSATAYGATYTNGDLIGVAVDMDAGTLTFYKNGTTQGQAFTGISGTYTFLQGMFSGTTGAYTVNFGQRAFAYTAPSGFKALNTANLSDPTIADGSTAMDVKLYTGNGSTQTISGLGFSPDLVWIKNRDSGSSYQVWFDFVRGPHKVIRSDSTAAEADYGQNGVSTFGTDSFTVVDDATGGYSVNGPPGGTYSGSASYVAWTWDAGTSNTSITAGSLNSSVYDQSQTWSNDLTSSPANSLGNAAAVFDGSELFTRNTNMSVGATVTFTPTGTITNVTKLEIKCGANNTGNAVFELNGVNKLTDYNTLVGVAAGVTDRYVDITSLLGGSTTLTSMKWGYNGSTNYNLIRNIKVNGALLVNSGVSVTNVPSSASTVRANPSAGFSIVEFTNPSSGNWTFGHGLNAAPEFFVMRPKGATSNWQTYHKGLTALSSGRKFIWLNSTNAEMGTTNTYWTSDPDSSVCYAGTGMQPGSQQVHIAYCFAPVEGYSSFGSYTGNGATGYPNADGPFVFTGMRPRWLLIKATSGTESWRLYDTERNTYNYADEYLVPNASDAEVTAAANREIDFLSNGFKIRGNNGGLNTNAVVYIYAAFAENPFKTARAR